MTRSMQHVREEGGGTRKRRRDEDDPFSMTPTPMHPWERVVSFGKRSGVHTPVGFPSAPSTPIVNAGSMSDPPVRVFRSKKLSAMLVSLEKSRPIPMVQTTAAASPVEVAEFMFRSAMRQDLVLLLHRLTLSFKYHVETFQHAVCLLDRILGMLPRSTLRTENDKGILPLSTQDPGSPFAGIKVRPAVHRATVAMSPPLECYWLVAVTCFYLAARLNEEEREPFYKDVAACIQVHLPQTMVQVIECICPENLKVMERRIARWLEWNLMCVTPCAAMEELVRGCIALSCQQEVQFKRDIAIPPDAIAWRQGWHDVLVDEGKGSVQSLAAHRGHLGRIFLLAEHILQDAVMASALYVGISPVAMCTAALACAVTAIHPTTHDLSRTFPWNDIGPHRLSGWKWMMHELAALTTPCPTQASRDHLMTLTRSLWETYTPVRYQAIQSGTLTPAYPPYLATTPPPKTRKKRRAQ